MTALSPAEEDDCGDDDDDGEVFAKGTEKFILVAFVFDDGGDDEIEFSFTTDNIIAVPTARRSGDENTQTSSVRLASTSISLIFRHVDAAN